MKLEVGTEIKPFKINMVSRPWGVYGLYADNVKSTTKILYIKPNESLSMQFHFRRCQLYLALDDDFIVQYSTVPVPKEILDMPDEQPKFDLLNKFLDEHLITTTANEGDLYGFHKFIVHRTTYKGKRDYGRILDVALGIEEGDENDELDIVRIRDEYGRSNFKV